MIHHSDDLTLKTTTSKWNGAQSWGDYVAGLKGKQKRVGQATVEAGLVIEGSLVEVRAHKLMPAPPQNFMIITVDIDTAKKRTFDPTGQETSDFNRPTEELVRKGYLNHHEVRTIADPSILNVQQVATLFNGYYATSSTTTSHGAGRTNRFELWGDVALIKPMNLNAGDRIHLKTKFDSAPIIESITVHKPTQAKTYHGENVVGGWGGRIMAQKDSAPSSSSSAPAQPGDCADDDEWN